MSAATSLPLDTLSDFKFWALQKPNAHKLLRVIIFRWRASSGRVPGKPGKWAVYPLTQWGEWSTLSSSKLERALKEVVDVGLIERERHRFKGTTVYTFLRPTPTGLEYAGKPQDMTALTPATAKIAAGTHAGVGEGAPAAIGAGTSAGTDHTSIPSQPMKPSSSKISIEEASESEGVEGKGSAGDEDDGDAFEKEVAKIMAIKKQKADKAFPAKKGNHEKYVKHPSEKFPNWLTFSKKLQAEIYEKYLVYVDNWYKGKVGKPQNEWSEWTDDDEAAFQKDMEESKKSMDDEKWIEENM